MECANLTKDLSQPYAKSFGPLRGRESRFHRKSPSDARHCTASLSSTITRVVHCAIASQREYWKAYSSSMLIMIFYFDFGEGKGAPHTGPPLRFWGECAGLRMVAKTCSSVTDNKIEATTAARSRLSLHYDHYRVSP